MAPMIKVYSNSQYHNIQEVQQMYHHVAHYCVLNPKPGLMMMLVSVLLVSKGLSVKLNEMSNTAKGLHCMYVQL